MKILRGLKICFQNSYPIRFRLIMIVKPVEMRVQTFGRSNERFFSPLQVVVFISMEDRISDGLLRNCTAMVLATEFNYTPRGTLELQNSTALLAVLGNMLTSADLTMSRRTMAKDRLHDCVYPVPEPSHNIAAWHKSVWSAVFVAMLIVSIVGNSIVIWIVTGKCTVKASLGQLMLFLTQLNINIFLN